MKLTDRENKIVELFKQGLTEEQIAEKLGPELCGRMIQSHMGNIARKMGFTTRRELEKELRKES
jgi:DNA-binding NarL/FixJ family response regulator